MLKSLFRPATLLKRDSDTVALLRKFAECLRTPILKKICEQQFLL